MHPLDKIANQKWFAPASAILLLLGWLWIGMTAALPGATTTGKIPAPQAGFLAPEFSLPASQGGAVSLADFRGHPVIINIWASWCGPCRAEMPALQKIYEQFADQGLVILAVNATAQDTETAALAFARDLGLTFPILLDRDGVVSRLYENRALPSTFFVGADGVITEVIIGGPMAVALLFTRVQSLLERPQ